MTQDTVSEYSNFRYYSEMLSSGALDEETARHAAKPRLVLFSARTLNAAASKNTSRIPP